MKELRFPLIVRIMEKIIKVEPMKFLLKKINKIRKKKSLKKMYISFL